MRQKRVQFKSIFYYLLALSLIPISDSAYGAIINVPTAAHPTIQAGIDAASTGDTVLVANGTFTGPGNRNIDFGGKAITVKSAGGPENCIVDVQGSSINPGRGFYFHSGEGENAVLSGFTITGGDADDIILPAPYIGGGIYIESNCSPIIENCIIRGNRGEGGGGIYSLGAPKITNCIIESNISVYSGAFHSEGPAIISDCIIRNHINAFAPGITAMGGTTIQKCSIINNVNYGGAGGVSLDNSEIRDSIIEGNSGKDTGGMTASDSNIIDCVINGNGGDLTGGIRMNNSVIMDSTISNNGSIYYAGGIDASGLSQIVSCNIFGNTSETNGGGVSCTGDSSIAIDRCNISDNRSIIGGGIYVWNLGEEGNGPSLIVKNSNILGNVGNGIEVSDNSSLDVINCTLSRNRNDEGFETGAIRFFGSVMTVTNSILWGNLDYQGNQSKEIDGFFDPNLITFSNINQDGFGGNNGNIRQDPLIVDPANGDFHLSEGSPCIDTATSVNAPDTDIDGDPRPQGAGFDMGADEWFGCSLPVGHLDYCRDCGPCAEGEGDCDNQRQCVSGTVCVEVPGVDTCQSVVCSLPVGHLDYCRDCGACAEGEGDCDKDGECQSGLICEQVPGVDTCQPSTPTCPHPVGHLDYCRDCGPCAEGEGDCDNDGECRNGLVCEQVIGTDTCQVSAPVCPHPVGHLDYCRDCGPCGAGDGDCDIDSECEIGLTCVQVTGTDTCQPSTPVCPHPVGHLDYCRDCGPCAAGQGDCDNDGECRSGLTCVQITGTDTCQ